jgi:hypothetical protein
MVFFGCSMDDPYIKALLDTVASDLWERGVTTHYVVLPLDEQLAKSIDAVCAQFQRFGLQPVLFDNLDGDFSHLDQLLDEAIERCPQAKPSVPMADPNSKPPTVFSQHPPPETTGQKLDVGPDWLEEVNRTTENSLKKDED